MRRGRRLLVAGLLLGGAWGMPVVGQQPAASASDTAWDPRQSLTGRAIACDNGRLRSLACQNVELLSYLPPDAMGGGRSFMGLSGPGTFDLWGWTDSATGREFAIVGGSDATSFVEVTDPLNPKYLGKLPFHDSIVGIAGVKVYQNHAFIVVEGTWALNGAGGDGSRAGLQVFDLTQLRDVEAPPAVFTEAAHYDKFGNAHTLTLDPATGFAYVNGSSACAGLYMVDVRVPRSPTFAGCFASTVPGADYVHDAMCTIYRGPDRKYQGREICLNASSNTLVLVDVTDKTQPKQISAATYPNVGFTHQGWLTEDQQYFFLNDETDDSAGGIAQTRTIVFDLKQLDDPVVLTQFYGTTTATDHNLYIRGRYMYQANYTAGLRIIDVADPARPQEVGYLDTAPNRDGPGMTLGAWGSYPFFKNDVVAVASRGLFLVRLRPRTP